LAVRQFKTRHRGQTDKPPTTSREIKTAPPSHTNVNEKLSLFVIIEYAFVISQCFKCFKTEKTSNVFRTKLLRVKNGLISVNKESTDALNAFLVRL
jgi:hypothetical protein